MHIDVADLSGDTFSIADLQPSDTVRQLFDKVRTAVRKPFLGAFNVASFDLLVRDSVLTHFELEKDLRSAGVEHGVLLQIVCKGYCDVWENTSDIGDEQQIHPRGASQTLVRFAFLTEKDCLLIRQTSAARVTGRSFCWDICRGTYTMGKGSVATCSWELCYRRIRSGEKRASLTSVSDSGWIRKETAAECWDTIELESGAWARQQALLQEDRSILGIKFFGPSTCAEAVELLEIL